MTISQSVSQAIAAGAIAQTTIEQLKQKVRTSTDTHALATLQDAINDGVVDIK